MKKVGEDFLNYLLFYFQEGFIYGDGLLSSKKEST